MSSDRDRADRPSHVPWLLLILLLGAALRLVPIWFGLPFDRARPDEETAIGRALAILDGDPNPHFFHWPSLTFYVFAGTLNAASWLQRIVGRDRLLSVNDQYLLTRGFVAVAGTATIAALFALTRRAFDDRTAVIASLFLAVAPLHVRESHFAMTDVLMTLFVTASIAVGLEAQTMPAFALAAFTAGLAASTKYTGAVALAAVAAALWRRTRDASVDAWQLWTTAAGIAVAFAAGFFVATPYALLDFRSFASGVGFDVGHLSTGHGFLDLGRGWTYHLRRSLPYGVGWPVLVAAVPGAVVMARHRPRVALVVGVFCATVYAVLGPGRTVFFRYVLPLVPFVCVLAAVAVRQSADWLGRRIPMLASGSALAVAIAVPSAVDSGWMDVLLARTDTRVLASRWVAPRATQDEALYDAGGDYAGSNWLGLRAHRWAVRTFDAPSGTFSDSGGREPDWLVLPESPLPYGIVPASLRRLAAERYELVETIAATRGPTDRSVYDLQDAFFLPIAGFEPIVRPGPTIRIYRRRPR